MHRHSAYYSVQSSEDDEASYYSASNRAGNQAASRPGDVSEYLAVQRSSGDGASGSSASGSVGSRSLPEPPQVRPFQDIIYDQYL